MAGRGAGAGTDAGGVAQRRDPRRGTHARLHARGRGGAEPIALLDYLAVEQADAGAMRAIAEGLKRGAEQAGVEIPGGEVAVLPELIRGHPSPHGFDLTAACFGTLALDRLITGEALQPGDALIGLPSSGLHSNGYTLARRALSSLEYDARPPALGGASVADALLEPTVIYVR